MKNLQHTLINGTSSPKNSPRENSLKKYDFETKLDFEDRSRTELKNIRVFGRLNRNVPVYSTFDLK